MASRFPRAQLPDAIAYLQLYAHQRATTPEVGRLHPTRRTHQAHLEEWAFMVDFTTEARFPRLAPVSGRCMWTVKSHPPSAFAISTWWSPWQTLYPCSAPCAGPSRSVRRLRVRWRWHLCVACERFVRGDRLEPLIASAVVHFQARWGLLRGILMSNVHGRIILFCALHMYCGFFTFRVTL